MSAPTPSDRFIGFPESIDYPDADTTECGPNLCSGDNDSAYPTTNGGPITCQYDTAGYIGQPVVLDCTVFAATETAGRITAGGTVISEFSTKCEPKDLTSTFVPESNTVTVKWVQTGSAPVYLDTLSCNADKPQAPLRETAGVGAGLADSLGTLVVAGTGAAGFAAVTSSDSLPDLTDI